MNIHLFRSFIEGDECCAKANRVNLADRLPVLRDCVTSHEISRIHHAGAKASGAEFGLMQRRGPGVELAQNAWTVAK